MPENIQKINITFSDNAQKLEGSLSEYKRVFTWFLSENLLPDT